MNTRISPKSKTRFPCFILLMLTAMCSGGSVRADGVARLDLGGAWQVTKEGTSETIPAVVPGCIHTDLLAAKKIPDPFYRDNEKAVQWVGEANWLYRRSFDVAPELLAHDHVVLKCEGLDTLATIRLNGTQVARTDNMFRTYEFDVKKLLKPGGNTIEIKFDSVLPLLRAKESQRKLPTWAYPGAGYVRKEPCNFGWDWGPTLITCGIWRKIGIEAFNVARLDEVAILQDHSKKGAVTLNVQVAARPATSDDLQARIQVFLGKKSVVWHRVDLKQGKANVAVRHRQSAALVAGGHGRPASVPGPGRSPRRRTSCWTARPSGSACGRFAPCRKRRPRRCTSRSTAFPSSPRGPIGFRPTASPTA